jgi:hypothetical protein
MRCHYVPYWYLKIFASRKYSKEDIKNRKVKLNVFNKKEKTQRKRFAGEIACKDSFYGKFIEKKLLKSIEELPLGTYKNILTKQNLDCLKDQKQKQNLALFIAVQMYRTKWFRETVLKKDLIPTWEKRGYSEIGSSKRVQEDIFLSLQVLELQTNLLLAKNWSIIVSKKKSLFWTSDNPVYFDPQLKKTDILYGDFYFPLSPNLLLFLTSDSRVKDCSSNIKEVSSDFVKEINERCYLIAEKYVISNKKFETKEIMEFENFSK